LLLLVPFWLLIFGLLGLYTERYYQNRFNELGRLTIAVSIGILFAISYSYLVNEPLFPARLVVVYGFIFSLLAVLLFRNISRQVQRELFGYGIGINNVLIVGDNRASKVLLETLGDSKTNGYRVLGIVGDRTAKGKDSEVKRFASFSEAIKHLKSSQLHTIFQTNLFSSNEANDEILNYAQSNHVAYRFVPGNSELFVGNIRVDLFNSIPVIAVHQTALIGWGRVAKRLTDVVLGGILLILTLPIMLAVIIIQFVSSPTSQIFYQPKRVSRFGNIVKIYKFRTHKQKYTNLSPEQAFEKMGKPELIKPYRENGEKLADDPRVSKFGKFMRKMSIDELPQLFNVVKGDISLVGPRAIDPFEMEQSDKKNLILSVKTGLTGLAQISGRRSLSFEEKRKIDLYYVQNWTFWGDLVIIARTVSVVLFHKGSEIR
jgi:exopolysaccharide biosynthesis polyprenyl glycosylphosphotransferase